MKTGSLFIFHLGYLWLTTGNLLVLGLCYSRPEKTKNFKHSIRVVFRYKYWKVLQEVASRLGKCFTFEVLALIYDLLIIIIDPSIPRNKEWNGHWVIQKEKRNKKWYDMDESET